MNANLIYPMFAMFVLTAVVLIQMFRRRVSAVKSGQVKLHYFKLYQDEDVPEEMVRASRHFSNLFEAPVLFYVVCILGILFQEGLPFLVLAWLYVGCRALHAYIHLGSNKVLHRMRAYGLSWLALSLMWGLLLWHQI